MGPLFSQGIYCLYDNRNKPFQVLNINYEMFKGNQDYYIVVTDAASPFHETIFVLENINGFNGHNLIADYKINKLCIQNPDNIEYQLSQLNTLLYQIIQDIGINFLNNKVVDYEIVSTKYKGTKLKIYNNTPAKPKSFDIVNLVIDGYNISSEAASIKTKADLNEIVSTKVFYH